MAEPLAHPPEHLTWNEVMSNVKVNDLLHSENWLGPHGHMDIVFVDREDTVESVLRTFIHRKISSAPVFDKEANCFIGTVDMLDLVGYCMLKCKQLEVQTWDKLRQAEEFMSCKVEFLIDISGRNKWRPVHSDAPMLILLDILSKSNIHRVPIVDPLNENKVLALVTQSRVVQWLDANSHKLGFPKRALQSQVKDWKVASRVLKEVVSISQEKTVADAFALLNEKGVSAVAVVDAEGRLMGNLSASDLKLVVTVPEQFLLRLYMPIKTFISIRASVPLFSEKELYRLHDLHSNIREDASGLPFPLAVKKESTLAVVLSLLQFSKGAHRLWVWDEERRPIGVISLGDLLAEFTAIQEDLLE